MKDRIEDRIERLRAELEKGQKMLIDLDAQRQRLQVQVLQIQGAIAVCEELLNEGMEDEN